MSFNVTPLSPSPSLALVFIFMYNGSFESIANPPTDSDHAWVHLRMKKPKYIVCFKTLILNPILQIQS